MADGPPILLDEVQLNGLAERIVARLRADQDKLLDLRELAERLSLSPRGVSGLIARGELPGGFVIGGVRRWRWTDVLGYLESRRNRIRRKGRGKFDRE